MLKVSVLFPSPVLRCAGAVNVALAPGKGGCRKSCGCMGSAPWKGPMAFSENTTWPNSIAAFRCGQRVGSPAQPRSGSHLLAAVRAHGEPGPHGQLSEPQLADRSGALASQPGGLHGNRASAFGWIDQPDARTASAGPIQRTR